VLVARPIIFRTYSKSACALRKGSQTYFFATLPDTLRLLFCAVSKPPCTILNLFAALSLDRDVPKTSATPSKPTSHITHHHPKAQRSLLNSFSRLPYPAMVGQDRCLPAIRTLRWRSLIREVPLGFLTRGPSGTMERTWQAAHQASMRRPRCLIDHAARAL
jgi:hypothetical protein